MSIERNVGVVDRLIRLAVSGVLFYFALYYPATANDPVTFYVLSAMGAINTVAALAGICPVYLALGVSTNKTVDEEA